MQDGNYQFKTILQSRYDVHLIGLNNTINAMTPSHFYDIETQGCISLDDMNSK